MRTARFALLVLLAALLGLPALTWTGLRLGLFTPFINYYLDSQLERVTPLRLRFGALRSDLLSFIEADDLVVLAPLKGAKVPLLTVSTLRLEGDGWAAARRRLDWRDALRLARVVGLNLFVLRDKQGGWNWAAAGGGKAAPSQAAQGKPAFRRDVVALMLATRLELEDSQVVFNDETRGFHSTVDRIQGSLDARALPLLAFSLAGRTEGQKRENLSLAGEYEAREGQLFARMDLGRVPLQSYVNYFLPVEGLRFTGGAASLSFRLTGNRGEEVQATGRADVAEGSLRIPGIAEPLSRLEGRVLVDEDGLRFPSVRAHFLDSDWAAAGSLSGLRHPRFDVQLTNPSFGLAALSRQVRGVEVLQLSGTAAVGVSMTGAVTRPLIQGWARSALLSLHGLDLAEVEAEVELEGARLDVTRLRGRLWSGALEGSTRIRLPVGGRRGQLDAEARLEGSKLEEFRYRGAKLLPLSGTAALDFRAQGPLDAPEIGLKASVVEAWLALWRLGRVDFEAGLDGEGTRAKLRAMEGKLRGSFGLSPGSPKSYRESRLEFDAVDLKALARGVAESPEAELVTPRLRASAAWVQARFGGVMDAVFGLEGPVRAPRVTLDLPRMEGSLRLSQGFLAMRDEAALGLGLRGRLALDGERLSFGSAGAPFQARAQYQAHALTVDLRGHYPLPTLRGRQGEAGSLELKAAGDLGCLDVFEFFNQSGGTLRSDLKLEGYPDFPLLEGLLEVAGFATRPARYTSEVSHGRLRAVAQGRVVQVEALEIQAGGRATAQGQLDFGVGAVPSGLFQVQTDDQGLRLDNWEGMGQGSVVLQPFTVRLHGGETGGVDLSGRVKLFNAVVAYEGRTSVQAARQEEALQAPRAKRPLRLDLAVALGANVWYENHHHREISVSEGLAGVLGSAYESAMETLLRPDMYFRLKPTEDDFHIRGTTPRLDFSGQLGIDRGKLTLMENAFDFKPDGSPPRIDFRGGHADMNARAVARMRYMRDNPLTGRPVQKAVNVVVSVSPMDPEEREDSGQSEAFLNYKLDFSSEPELVQGNPAKQREAILNLMVLGDPLTEEENAGPEGVGRPGAGQLGINQLNRLLEGELRKQVAKLSKKGLRFMGSSMVDVFRVVPRWKYGAAGGSGKVQSREGQVTAAEASKQAQENTLYFSDVTMEVGKSLFENFYASMQAVKFGEAAMASQAQTQSQASVASNRVTRDFGVRVALEYQIGANRSIEAYYGYSLDDNLEPLPFDAGDLTQAHNVGARIRNTLATDNYSAAVARRRRYRELAR